MAGSLLQEVPDKPNLSIWCCPHPAHLHITPEPWDGRDFSTYSLVLPFGYQPQAPAFPIWPPQRHVTAPWWPGTNESFQGSTVPCLLFHFQGSCHIPTHLLQRWRAVWLSRHPTAPECKSQEVSSLRRTINMKYQDYHLPHLQIPQAHICLFQQFMLSVTSCSNTLSFA